jgi:glycosyltransferase involved in cell wall biosynthesis
MKKVSFVCTTYRRFTCVERIIAQFYAQTYPNKELIIFNTDMKHQLSLGFDAEDIILVNNDTDYVTGKSYENRGQICRDAVTHATGDYFMLADDDDIYLPWHIQQAVDKIEEVGKDAWKPEQSFFATPDKVMLVKNTLEASVIVKMDRIRQIGFRMGLTGYEGLSWYTQLRDERQLDENYRHYVPSYCFNWSDPAHIAGHKQSGNINSPTNFEEHKQESRDIAIRPLEFSMYLLDVYERYYDYYRSHPDDFPLDMMNKYVNHLI